MHFFPAAFRQASLWIAALAASVCFAGSARASLAVPDGSGGTIAVWTTADGRLLAQRQNGLGATTWPREGVPLSNVAASAQNVAVVSDGAGGVIVAWRDARSGSLRVYAQRLDGSGAAQWPAAGVELNAAPADAPDVAPDGAGGAFVVWSDTRGATASDVYIQRVSPSGTTLWTFGGVVLANTPTGETGAKVVADGQGGAIATWSTSSLVPRTVLAQKIDGSGAAQWTAGGIALVGGAGVLQMTTDGNGGAIASCVGDSGSRFVAQRVTSAGQMPWGATGRVFAQFDLGVTWGLFPAVVTDGLGGAILAWYGGTQALGGQSLIVTRIDAAGTSPWGSSGLTVAPVGTSGEPPWIAPDGSGGALLAWSSPTGSSMDVYAQRVNAAGVLQWLSGGVPVCAAPEYQSPLAIVSAGAGGATVVWGDRRNLGSGSDVYAQRLSGSGGTQWRTNGTPVYLERIGQRSPAVVADGEGGALTTWIEEVDGIYQIRARRYDALGQPRGAVAILCGVDSHKGAPFAVSDGAGGILAAWFDERSDATPGTYVQRMDSSGVVRWAADGVLAFGSGELGSASALCSDGAGGAFLAFTTQSIRVQHVNASGATPWGAAGAVASAAPPSILLGHSSACVTSDGQGGAIAAWVDTRSYQSHCISGCGTSIFAQRVDGSGVAVWTANGIQLRSPIKNAYGSPEIAGDGSGGALVVWEDQRSGSPPSLYGQHLDSAGSLAWLADGLSLCPGGTASHPSLVATAPGHVILAWADSRSGTGLDLYAQHLGYPTPALWSATGLPLCTASGDQVKPVLAADGAAGAIATWADSRDDGAFDVYAQRIGAAGAPQWSAAGVAVSTGTGGQVAAVLAAEPDGGATVAWQDARGGFSPFIGVRRLGSSGELLTPTVGVDPASPRAGLELTRIHPNPAHRGFTAVFSLPDAGPASLEMLDLLGRRVAALEVGGQAVASRSVTLRPAGLAPGVYLVRLVHSSGMRVMKAVVLE